MGGAAEVSHYQQTLTQLLDSHQFDVILVMYAPAAVGLSEQIAQAVIQVYLTHPNRRRCTLMTQWSGEDAAYQARKHFNRAGIATYRTPESAVGAFIHMVEFQRNQHLLKQVPTSISCKSPYDNEFALQTIEQAVTKQQWQLSTVDAAKILSAFNINVLKAHVAMNADEAVAVATNIGFPVALKLRDSKLRHHSDIQAVLLHLNNAQEVIVAATSVIQRVQQLDCEFSGFIIQKMALTAGAQEIRVAVINDSTFGPVICIGEGGSEWQPLVDAEVALPPLNMALARYSVQQALNRKVLKNRYVPQPFNIEALCLVLCQISDMIIACPQIEAIDFNPILMKGNDLTVLDVNVTLMPQLYDIASKLTIMPYPKSLESYATLKNGQIILMRPILPEDEPNHLAFDNSLSAEDRYKRYFGVRSAMTHEEMAVLTQIDYAREMAFIAVDQSKQTEVTLGAIRATIDPDNIEAEFAMAVRTNYQGQGIGRLLLVKLIEYYRTKQTKKLTGYTMLSNRNMASLAKQLGFKVTTDVEDGLIYMELIY